MTDAPIQIRKPEVVRAVRALAEKTGRDITETIGAAVNTELRRLEAQTRAERDRKLAAMRDAVRRFNELPIVGPLLTDEDFYDSDGLPR